MFRVNNSLDCACLNYFNLKQRGSCYITQKYSKQEITHRGLLLYNAETKDVLLAAGFQLLSNLLLPCLVYNLLYCPVSEELVVCQYKQ